MVLKLPPKNAPWPLTFKLPLTSTLLPLNSIASALDDLIVLPVTVKSPLTSTLGLSKRIATLPPFDLISLPSTYKSPEHFISPLTSNSVLGGLVVPIPTRLFDASTKRVFVPTARLPPLVSVILVVAVVPLLFLKYKSPPL